MSDRVKYQLGEDRIPRVWYNIAADLPPAPPVLHPGTGKPIGPDDLAPLFPMALIGQEVSAEREIEIPDPVREIYRMWRPTPLYRARGLEKALGTPARIFYKYEGVSPAGSHKPNTAVAQAFYNKQAGVKQLTTETGAGQWGSSLAFAGALFGLEVKVYMVRVSYDQKPYRRALMETYGATCVASPSNETNAGRAILAQDPNSPGSLGIAISEAVEIAAQSDDTKYSLGSVLNHVLLHQTVIGQEAIEQMEAADAYPGRGHRLRRRRLQFRRHRLPVPRQEAARQARRAHHRGRAGGLPVADARPLRLRFRRHRPSDAAGQDAHARLDLHPAGLPRRRPALPRHVGAGQPVHGARADRGARLPPEPVLRSGRAVRPHRRHRAGAGIEPCGARRDRRGAEGARGRQVAERSCSICRATATSTCRPTSTISAAS